MKALARVYSTSLLITALSFATTVFAKEDPLVEKVKTYSKSYSLSGSDKISLNNQFGEMKISTWDKNEVKVDVTIKAEAGTEERAQYILNKITIDDSKNGSGVSFKTKVGNNDNDKNGNWERGEKQSFSINYVVYVPANNPLDATNQFGPMTIGDFKGEASLESKFGSLTSGTLSNAKRVSVEFGVANIEGISNGVLSIKFSRGIVNNLDGSVKATFEHCNGIKLVVNNNMKKLDINNSFTHLYLDVSTNLSANFDIHTSFCDVKNKTSFAIKKDGDDDDDNDRGPKFDFDYSGKAGSGTLPIKIKSSFGDITVDHNISFDVNEKKKEKNKSTRNI